MPRKYFLDWLRVIAFALLIAFHVGCLYASWPYNLKAPQIRPGIDAVLMALNPWRLALLFLISGVACRVLLAKLGPGGLALDRLRRLVPVLLFGMFVIIPPQTYVELLSKGLVHEGYLRFWVFSYLAADQTLVAPLHKTMPTYDHLWFVAYLLDYALILAAGAALAARLPRLALPRLPLALLVVGPGLWLVFNVYLMERVFPQTFWVGSDWGAHLKWGGMFAIGLVLAGRDDFWAWARRRRLPLALAALVLLALQTLNHALWRAGQADPLLGVLTWSLASGLFAWTTICALSGYAAHYFDRPSGLLSALNPAILPVYVLHQPILLIAAYMLFPLGLPWLLEAGLLGAITALGAVVIYVALIRPFAPMRFLFGLKSLHGMRRPAPVPG